MTKALIEMLRLFVFNNRTEKLNIEQSIKTKVDLNLKISRNWFDGKNISIAR